MESNIFADKQLEFIFNSNATFNIAHGPVRCGKTVGVFYKFIEDALRCPGEQIWMIGHTHDTIYHNCIRLLLDEKSPQFGIYTPFCQWAKGDRMLHIRDKKIYCLGASDEKSIGPIQGKTFDLCYCNEMTLYPTNVIQMIATRLSMPHSKLYADMNPVQPDHICKKWIDLAREGDKKYYELQFNINDNPYLAPSFIETLKQTLSGVFYRRNFLGEWCQAEGAIFPFFDKEIHCVRAVKGTTLYWIAGIDYGTDHAFACVLIRVSKLPERGVQMWVEKEYFWDSKKQGRTKSPSEYAQDVKKFLEDYSLRSVYIDPSAAMFSAELRKYGIHTVGADNDVEQGILSLIDVFSTGMLLINPSCVNLVREIQGYVWDPKKSKLGYDEPLKVHDDAIDALRYAIRSYRGDRNQMGAEGNALHGSLVGKKNNNPGPGQQYTHEWPKWR